MQNFIQAGTQALSSRALGLQTNSRVRLPVGRGSQTQAVFGNASGQGRRPGPAPRQSIDRPLSSTLPRPPRSSPETNTRSAVRSSIAGPASPIPAALLSRISSTAPVRPGERYSLSQFAEVSLRGGTLIESPVLDSFRLLPQSFDALRGQFSSLSLSGLGSNTAAALFPSVPQPLSTFFDFRLPAENSFTAATERRPQQVLADLFEGVRRRPYEKEHKKPLETHHEPEIFKGLWGMLSQMLHFLRSILGKGESGH